MPIRWQIQPKEHLIASSASTANAVAQCAKKTMKPAAPVLTSSWPRTLRSESECATIFSLTFFNYSRSST